MRLRSTSAKSHQSSGSDSMDSFEIEPCLTDAKSRPVLNLQDDDINLLISEADELDEMTPMPKLVGGLQIS